MVEKVGHWRQLLASSLQANGHLKHSSYFQLATVRRDGRPANRTVVFRGFVDECDTLQFTTDARSNKIEEIHSNPRGEVCWYFTDTWEQYRVQGILDVISSSEVETRKKSLREKAWFESSAHSRLQFLGPAPKLPSLHSTSTEVKLDPTQGPVDAFCLVLFDPEEVDYLNVKKNRRVVFTHTPMSRMTEADSHETWSELEVNP
eukprot:c13389_g1_i1 orf=335-943(-)